jgi:hypothetical protein
MQSLSSHSEAARTIVTSLLEAINREDFTAARAFLRDDMKYIGVFGSRDGADASLDEVGFMTRFAPRFTLTRIRSSTSPGRLSRGQLGCESRLPERPKGTGWQWFTCPGVDAGQVDMLPGLRRDVWQQMVRDITPA